MNNVNSAILDSSTGWLILAIFSVIWIALGWFWGRKATQLDEFMLAGRNVGISLATATAMATWVTSNTTMAAPSPPLVPLAFASNAQQWPSDERTMPTS
jgi:hypothetical protein